MNDIQHCATFIGYLTIIVIVIGIILLFIELIKWGLENLKRIYKYKHRFDKKPTAKCYCVDCIYHNNSTGKCFESEIYLHTADDWFCCDASPRKDKIQEETIK